MPTKKKTDYCVFHPSKKNTLLCLNCGGEHALAMPMATTMFSAIGKQFSKDHRNCPKTWQLPEPPAFDAALTKEQRIHEWLANGRRGVSSNTMLQVIEGIRCVNSSPSHPWDPSDFKRCHLLLQAVPELREGFPKLAATSKPWKALIDNWDELTALLQEQIDTGKVNGMYERMKELIDGKPRGKMFDQQPA